MIIQEITKGITIISAGKRNARPHVKSKIHLCQFDPGNEKVTTKTLFEIDQNTKWVTRVFENLYPALPKDHHEVIVETAKHDEQFEKISSKQLAEIFQTYVNRYIALSKKPGVKYVFLMKNHGREAGASIPHEHSQILALPFVPEFIASEFNLKGKCIFCQTAKQNIVFQNEKFAVVRPSFARFPLECWVIPKQHLEDFTEFDNKTALLLMQALQESVKGLKHKTESYNFAFHNSFRNGKVHFHVEVYPRTDIHAGLELGTGTIINAMDVKKALAILKAKN
ncbi:MAG: DUF4931 domain-containing protein [Candidatus Micrarchaeota archaeon]